MIKIYSFDQTKQISQLLKTKQYVAVVETDTVMGLISLNPKLIYQIKERPTDKKLIFFINNINQVKDLSEQEKKVVSKYWPGGLTIIKNKISYRIPNNQKLLSLIKLTGPIYSSSANISGEAPIKNAIDACNVFKKHLSKLIIIKGSTKKNIPSTIIDLDNLKIIREGKYKGSEIVKQLRPLIYISSDHAGYQMKKQIIKKLNKKYNFKDLGPNNGDVPVDYPIYALKVANAVNKIHNAFGILICGTGFGMCIAANKVKGIRAICIHNYKLASLAREHNNCNIVTLSARFNTLKNNIKIINNFISTKFDSNDPKNKRHIKRLNLIKKIEEQC